MYSADDPLSSPLQQTLPRYDSCCSINDLSLLYDVVKLNVPVPIFGINGCIYLTHTGKMKNLPETNKANKAYYSKSIDVTLISLGYIQARGGSYSTTNTNQLDIYLPDHTLLESASRSSNMTYTMSPAVRSRDMRDHLTAYTATAPSQHVNAEQRSRCDLVQDVIVALSFPSDASLSDDLRYGKIIYKPYNTLTPHDVELNRRLRKESPHTAAGKHRSAPLRSPPLLYITTLDPAGVGLGTS